MPAEPALLNLPLWRELTADGVALPHALLFAGPSGVGKRELAEALAARLLCERPRAPHEAACGQCPACLMWASGQHPDARVLQPDAAAEDAGEEDAAAVATSEKKKDSQQIRISQVREIEAFFHIGSHRGGARVCLIEPAEAMNAVTANALLKILEEPAPGFYFLLVSHHWRRLLPTILSRTRRVACLHPAPDAAARWLTAHQLARQADWLPFFGHAPLAVRGADKAGRLKALETLVADLLKPQDALALAGRWETLVKTDAALDMEALVTTVQKWLFDLAQCAAGAAPRYLPGKAAALNALARRATLPALLQAYRQIIPLRALAQHPLNPRLFLEDLCLRAFQPFQSRS